VVREEEQKALEEFLMDIEVLDKIESKFSSFNVFETMGMVHTEIRHSNVLSWLLTPNENHEFGDFVIRKLIKTIVYNNRELPHLTFNPIEISLLDYHDFIVMREWKNIDVLAVSEANKFVVVIENKVWSGESEHQLNKYRTIIEDEYKSYNKLFIFLTPFGEEPSDTENWVSLDYNTFTDIVGKGLSYKSESMSEKVRLFIEQYLETVRRYIVGDMELEKVCREIYFKHKKALDLIFEYKPDIYSDISNDLQELVECTPGLVLDNSNKTYVRFTTTFLDELFDKLGSGWTSTKRILLFELQNKNNKLVLKLIIGPGDNDLRNKIYEVAQNNKDIFKGQLGKLSGQYTQIFSKEILSKRFYEEADYEKMYNQIEKNFGKFQEKELENIQEAFQSDIDI